MSQQLVVESRERDELARALRERTAQLEAVTREYDQFTHSVSHDLRAPLRALEGFSEILIEDYSHQLDGEAKRCLEIISASSRKASQLIEDLLVISRLSRRPIEPARIDMRELVLETAESLKPDWSRVELQLADMPEAWGDRELLGQVWRRLMENALKFTRFRQQPIIQIGGNLDSDYTAYFVRDNGAGFDMKHVSRLFGVFQRLHSDQEFEGRGIGLAVVQRIVRRHGGEVGAEGTPQQGASFYFSLPVHKELPG